MTTRYTYATSLAYSTGDVPETDEVEVEVSFTVAWGSPGTVTPYYGPPENYDPGSPSEIEDLKLISADGVGGPFDQHDEAAILQALAQNHVQQMLEAANDREAYWADDEADYRREAGR
jgi:hypothetical protein